MLVLTGLLFSSLSEASLCVIVNLDVLIGNLPSSTAERDLEEEFIRFGTLRSVWVARKPPGFGEELQQDLRGACSWLISGVNLT